MSRGWGPGGRLVEWGEGFAPAQPNPNKVAAMREVTARPSWRAKMLAAQARSVAARKAKTLARLAAASVVSGCAWTGVDVGYTDPNGKDIQVSYWSTKDITLDVVRDAEGNLQQLHVGGAASPVIAAQGETIERLGSAIGVGVASGMRAAAGLPPAAVEPQAWPGATEPERLLWQVDLERQIRAAHQTSPVKR